MPRAWLGPLDDPYVRVLHAIGEELDGLVVPEGPPRRALDFPAPAVLAELRRTFERPIAEVVARRWAASYVVHLSISPTTGIGSTLFAAGAPHPTWRRWMALAAASHRLVGEWCAAVTLGALAGEWTFVERIDDTREELDASSGAIWGLLDKRPHVDLASVRDEPEAVALWTELVGAASKADAGVIERALARLVDRALAGDDRVTSERVFTGDPASETFRPSAWAPYTEAGAVAAAAAILKRRGFVPSARFGEARRRFVEPGLADGDSWLGAERFLPDGGRAPP